MSFPAAFLRKNISAKKEREIPQTYDTKTNPYSQRGSGLAVASPAMTDDGKAIASVLNP